MRFKSGGAVWIKLSVVTGLLLTLMPVTAVPVWSAPALSRELKMTIMNRLPIAEDRDKLLRSAARAVENGYPEDRLNTIIGKSLDDHISADALSKMIDTLDEARRKDLPTEPYAEKIMEGLAKNVREDLILLALGKVGKRMEFAASQVEKMEERDGLPRVLIIKTSDAIAAGMDRKNLEKIYDVMARGRSNRKIEPEDIMEMVKAASGYGVKPRSVRNHAISLMKSKSADLDDIRKYLERLSGNAYRRRSGRDLDHKTDRHSDGADDDGHEEDSSDDGGDSDSGDDEGGDDDRNDDDDRDDDDEKEKD